MKCRMMEPVISACYLPVVALAILILHHCQGALRPTDTKHFSKHNCHSENQRQIKMACDSGYMIRIKRVFYGYNHDGNCYYQSGDCIHEEQSYYPCVGRQTCEINAPRVAGRLIQKCQQESNYFQVDYECVSVQSTMNICKHGELTDLRGFIKSPNYPLSHFGQLQCRTKIRAPLGYKVRLHIIDLDLRENGYSDCNDSLSLIQLSTVTLCGRRGNEDIELIPLNTMLINFQASAGKGKKGFWLYYEAYDTRTTTSTIKPKLAISSLPPKTVEDKADTTKSDVEEPSENRNTPQSLDGSIKSNDKIPFAAIIGGVIGSLLLVLIILVAILLLKWSREQCEFQHRTQKKFREVRNNAFQSSNDLFPPVQMEV